MKKHLSSAPSIRVRRRRGHAPSERKTAIAAILVICAVIIAVSAACAAMDSMRFGSVVGSLAGEDTFLCITKDENRSVDLVTELKKLLKNG